MYRNNTKKGYDVFKNGVYLGFIVGRSKQVRVETAKKLVLSTHMSQWTKIGLDYEYCTTIGVYIKFEACKRLSPEYHHQRIDFSKPLQGSV